MLAFADDAALARLVIAATAVPHHTRSSWLRNLAHMIEDRAATTPCPAPPPSPRPQARPPPRARTSRRVSRRRDLGAHDRARLRHCAGGQAHTRRARDHDGAARDSKTQPARGTLFRAPNHQAGASFTRDFRTGASNPYFFARPATTFKSGGCDSGLTKISSISEAVSMGTTRPFPPTDSNEHTVSL